MARAPEITFRCPACQGEAVCALDGRGACPACGAQPALEVPESWEQSAMVDRCPACGSGELYVQSDFNQRVGIAVVAVGAVLAPFTSYLSLVAAAAIDAALYTMLPQVTICYRCHAHFRGFRRNPAHHAFDLHVAEQYDVHRPPQG